MVNGKLVFESAGHYAPNLSLFFIFRNSCFSDMEVVICIPVTKVTASAELFALYPDVIGQRRATILFSGRVDV